MVRYLGSQTVALGIFLFGQVFLPRAVTPSHLSQKMVQPCCTGVAGGAKNMMRYRCEEIFMRTDSHRRLFVRSPLRVFHKQHRKLMRGMHVRSKCPKFDDFHKPNQSNQILSIGLLLPYAHA